MGKLKLEVNTQKTRVCRIPEESFDFLGYAIGRCYSPKTGRAYIGTCLSEKKIKGIMERISQMTTRSSLGEETAENVGQLNALLCEGLNPRFGRRVN